jgi:hypothetical protein
VDQPRTRYPVGRASYVTMPLSLSEQESVLRSWAFAGFHEVVRLGFARTPPGARRLVHRLLKERHPELRTLPPRQRSGAIPQLKAAYQRRFRQVADLI